MRCIGEGARGPNIVAARHTPRAKGAAKQREDSRMKETRGKERDRERVAVEGRRGEKRGAGGAVTGYGIPA